MKFTILFLGASYGSLFATKVLLAGHRVELLCTRPTAELINRRRNLGALSNQGSGVYAQYRLEATAGLAVRHHPGRGRS